jgi:integrase
VDQYILFLKNTGLSNNSIRTKLMACSSFYTTLRRYRHINLNPFYNCQLPKKQYKKSIQVDQNKTIPVMTAAEYKTILNTLIDKSKLAGSHKNRTIKKASMSLIPAVHFLACYGLRVGSLQTIRINKDNFTYKAKGSKSSCIKLAPDSIRILKQYKLIGTQPFKDYKIITIQKAISRLTVELKTTGKINYNYSAHDFRHYFAIEHYKKNKDIVMLKKLLNHSSIQVTDIYLQSIGVN